MRKNLINNIVATKFSFLKSTNICNLDELLKAVRNIDGFHYF